MLVAAGGRLRNDAVLPRPPRQETARWAPLPHLMPLVAQLGPVVPHVVVLVDRVGAEITVHGPHGAGPEQHEVAGGTRPIRKGAPGGWSQRRYQSRAENLWSENARQVAEVIDSAVRRGAPRLVVLAGDVRARHELYRVLEERTQQLVIEVEGGSRGAGADETALDRRVERLVAEAAARADAAVVDRFAQGAGQGGGAVDGLAATVAALRRAQVETLLVADDPSATGQAWIGPEPVQLALAEADLHEFGVPQPQRDRLDAALLRAAVGTKADLVTLATGQLELADGVGAVLRYPDPATG